MASGAFDDEELSISLSGSQSRRPPHPNPRHPRIRISEHDQQQAPIDRMAPGNHRPGQEPGADAQDRIRSTDSRLDQYKIERTLGEGSFGKVKLATHKSTGQKVALKIISRKKLISRDMTGRVEREIEFLQLLRHPHIIKLYTVIKDANDIIMVLEYAGGELFDYIVSVGKMPEAEARTFFQQIIAAVEYCHRYRIVHRDLKPENLLLDDQLNVKIADFGLSNIMTDGNFLKTSCGSPNYAAPEVIGGKLYAGPEVDVWSCGVILYVLLVGRLPFDDDHIPSLFAKIARGAYMVPQWMSSGAANLIKRMLIVNPVQRATIEDIRQDPWFTKDLKDYLKPKVESFFNTGIDPEKAIKASDIAPNAPPKLQEKLHAEVFEKISKTMGYGHKDVQEALDAEEPSAIKDAYMIVRENKLMQIQPNLGADNPYFATSPPANNTATMENITAGMNNLNTDGEEVASPLASASMSSARSMGSTSTGQTPPRPYVSTIGILPSSLPAYHRAFMAGNIDATAGEAPNEPPTQPRTDSEREETARRLRPHSRPSQLRLDEAIRAPQTMTPVTAPTKKHKAIRWQFGIRSRNTPFEALLCIYKALKKLGVAHVKDEGYNTVRGPESEGGDGTGIFGPDPRTGVDPTKKYKLPADPWKIRVAWETDKITRRAVTVNMATEEEATIQANPDATGKKRDIGRMWMTIQIYEMDPGVYLVDFKCDGYETPDGQVLMEKDVTSPFPFLDLSAQLIMQLAEAD